MTQWARRLFECSAELLAVLGPDGRIHHANPSWRGVVGWPPEALEAGDCRGFVHPEDLEAVEARLRAVAGRAAQASFRCRWRCEDGGWRWLSWRVASSAEDGLLYCTVRPSEPPGRTAGEALHSEENFRKLIENAPEGIFVHREQRFVYANPALLAALGYARASELVGRSIWDIVHPEDLDMVRQRVRAVTTGQLAPLREVRYLRRDGTWFDAESMGMPIEFDGADAICVMARDITERKRMQAQLLQSDRMALLGTLAAGVGHEINNPLAYVLSNLELARALTTKLAAEGPEGVPASPQARERASALRELEEMLGEAMEGAERVRNIVRDLRVFSRQEREVRNTAVDVRESLDFAIKLASGELRHRAQLFKKYESVPSVYADASRLGQVFLNLLVNAAQAIPEGNAAGNHVTVWVRPAGPGQVAVDVSDTGVGIPPDTLARIFDPFFTTKPAGIGTGLGLSICHGILRGFGGDISVRSEVGRGTTFTVLLPTSAAEVVTVASAS